MTKSLDFHFLPLNFSWVALHPKPIGIIYFIGGAFFGTFPTFFYRYLLKHLFEKGYSIVALPYRFSFRHWSVAINLVQDQENLQKNMLLEAKYRGYDYSIYEEYLNSKKECLPLKSDKYFWLGHSLGCKYIALLELLTNIKDPHELKNESAESLLGNNCISVKDQKKIAMTLADVDLKTISLYNQSSILMAPAIEGLEGAIPIFRNGRFANFKNFLNSIGIKVEPSQKETFCLIEKSSVFNLTSLISFDGDTRVAAPTVKWLLKNIDKRLVQIKELQGKHLAPLGWINGDPKIAQTVESFLNSK
jgi:hypothetical protein